MLQTRSAAGALARNAAGAQRRRCVDPSRKKLVARAKRGSRALTRRGKLQVFSCELPVGSEHAASRAKKQATVTYIYIRILLYLTVKILWGGLEHKRELFFQNSNLAILAPSNG